MSVAVMIFPGTNSEDETLRAVKAAGLDGRLVHWSADPASVRGFDAYILPGGFAYEDRIRAGAVAAHDKLMDVVIDGAQAGKLVLGLCNGAQILLETGLVPGTGPIRRPTAAFAPNAHGGRFRSVRVYARLVGERGRSPFLAALDDRPIPMWASHGDGRLVASPAELQAIEAGGHIAFVYSDEAGITREAVIPNGSALGVAGLLNARGNVLAIMPHPERDGWVFQHRDGPEKLAAMNDKDAMLAPSGGSVIFSALARALGAGVR